MSFYSGQGKLYTAKRDAAGNLGPFFPLGNVPRFYANFRSGRVELVMEEVTPQTAEILFGGRGREATTSEFVSVGPDDFKARYPDAETVAVEIEPDGAHEWFVVLEGINTASTGPVVQEPGGARFSLFDHLLRLELARVTFGAAEGMEGIGDEFAVMPIVGQMHKCEKRGWGRAYNIKVDGPPKQTAPGVYVHKESQSGMRLQDARVVV